MNGIFCIYNDNVIGIDGVLPSQIIPSLKEDSAVKTDMSIFTHVTKDAHIVMGRKTWESLGSKPLPRRSMNIVITSDPDSLAKKTPLWKFNDRVNFLTKEQFEKWKYINDVNVWIIGGVSLLKEYLPCCEQVYCHQIILHNNSEIDKIEDERKTIFSMEEVKELLAENKFDINVSPDYVKIGENADLYSYRFIKNYKKDWVEK